MIDDELQAILVEKHKLYDPSATVRTGQTPNGRYYVKCSQHGRISVYYFKTQLSSCIMETVSHRAVHEANKVAE